MKKLILAMVLGLSTVIAAGSVFAAGNATVQAAIQKHKEEVANPVNLNSADADQLMQVRGITAKRAAAIVDYRSKHGNFKKVDDLMKVPGFNETAYKRIHNKVTV